MKVETRISLIYVIFCGLYIIGSDHLVFTLFDSVEQITTIQSYKGIGFVLLSGLLIFLLVRRGFKNINDLNDDLEKTIHYHRMIFDKSPLPAYIIDKATLRYLVVNEAALIKFGMKRQDFESMRFYDLTCNMTEDQCKQLVEEVTDSGYLEAFLEFHHANGAVMHQQIFCQNIVYNEKQAILAMALDISSIKDPEVKVMDRMLDVLEEERRQLSSEIHDGIKQYFGLANGMLKSYQEKNVDSRNMEAISRAIQLTDEGIRESRRLSHMLTPVFAQEQELEMIMSHYIDNLNFSHKTQFRLVISLHSAFKSDMIVNVYRIVQEATRNINVHARATEALVELVEKDGYLDLQITDNGVGFDKNFVAQSMTSLGLTTMRTRGLKLKGFFSLKSEPGQGTKVHLRVPVDGNIVLANQAPEPEHS